MPVGQMLRSMSSEELTEWSVFMKLRAAEAQHQQKRQAAKTKGRRR